MTDMERKTFCAALSRYGAQAQITMVFEEMAELQDVLCKFLRGRVDGDTLANIAEEIADGDQAAVGGRSGNAAVCREGVERESGHLCPVEPVLVGKGAGLDDQALRDLWAGRLEALSHAAQRREV